MIPLHVGVQYGSDEEFRSAINIAADRVDELSTMGVDYILVNGAIPPMMLGYPKDHELAAQLTEKYGITVEMDTIILLNAMKKMSSNNVIFMSHMTKAQNEGFRDYLLKSGINVVDTVPIEVPSLSFPHKYIILPKSCIKPVNCNQSGCPSFLICSAT